ncbi:MAG: hypothetical protein EU547_04385 [Promethearchaeota archaeon]|nr:MAG: hypothetical protein EU547_04385 [Candidatus Lokiarchaeota archaeon]
MNKINRIILCIIDDIRATQFLSMIKKGLLPNCKKLMESGISSMNCVTDFPSITYPTQISTITGTYTGDYTKEPCHGVPLFNWMGRNYSRPILRNYGSKDLQIYKMNDDLGTNCQTICEMIEEGNKTSITQYINRGVDYFFPDNKRKLVLFYLLINYYRKVKTIMKYANSIVVHKLLDNFKKPKHYFETNEPPICSLIWFMTSDVLMHQYGNESMLYKLNLLHIDKVIGELVDGLEKLGYMEDTAIAITADHGNYKANKVGNINNILNSLGLTQYHPRKNKKGNMDLAEFGGVGFFNFRGNNFPSKNNLWPHPSIRDLKNYGPKKINLLDQLFKIEGTSLMYYPEKTNTVEEGKIFLKRKVDSGDFIHGRIEYRGMGRDMETRYILPDGERDVFGYSQDTISSKLLDGKFHNIQEWLQATHHLDFPLYPDHLCRHFKNPRSADIILSTEGRVTFNIEHGEKKHNLIYKHDIGARKSSIVPLIIAGSGDISKKKIEYCKITDIVPTLLELLGKCPHYSVIGESLL